MENKVIITDNEHTINNLLKEGWVVKFVSAQHVSSGGTFKEIGKFCFVLERPL